MENVMAVKDVFKRVRFQLGKNQTEMAKFLGVHKSVINMYEMGKRKPGFPKIRSFVKKLKEEGIEVKYEDFIDIED